MKSSEDMDPIETVIDWLEYLVHNGKVSMHDAPYLRQEVIPKAKAQYLMLTSVKGSGKRFEFEAED